MKTKLRVFVVGLVSTVLLVVGCLCTDRISKMSNDELGLDVGIVNASLKGIADVYVCFGDYVFKAGVVGPGKKAVHVCSGQRLPKEAEVGYRSSSGGVIVEHVIVKSAVQIENDQHCLLYFVVSEDEPVKVEVMRFVQVNGAWTTQQINE